MNTKKAIYFLEHDIKLFPHEAKSLPACLEIHKCAERIEEVIELLKRGEKFEAMWEEFNKKYGNYYYAYDVRGSVCKKHEYIETFLNKIKQKYFPKK